MRVLGSAVLAMEFLVMGFAMLLAKDNHGSSVIIYGAVVDFVLLHWRDWTWYVFNLADAAIVAGVALLLYESWLGNERGAANAPGKDDLR